MIALVLIVGFGLVFAYFATQNTAPVDLVFWTYALHGVPLYIVVLGTLVIGLVLSTTIGVLKAWSARFTISKKDSELKQSLQEKTELTKMVHKLELENTKIKTELGGSDVDENAI